MWRLNNTILNNAVIKEEISRKIFLNINGSKTYQNLWDATKEVLRGTLNACISKEEIIISKAAICEKLTECNHNRTKDC